MSVTIFGLFVLALGIWCQFGSYRRAVVAMLGLVIFGAAAALELPALGGATVAPADLFILFFALRLISMRDGTRLLLREMAPSRPLFIFAMLNLWILGAAFLTPRLFEGATAVFSLSRTLDVDGTVPLHPTSGNISQAVYAMGGFVLACASSALARKRGAHDALLSGLALVTCLDIAFAILDLVTSATHTGFLMDAIHTGGFAFLTEDELGGIKRISGSFSEASAFSSFSLMLLGVNVPLYVMRVRPRFTGMASLTLILFIGLSTSSSGYVGLAVFSVGFVIFALTTALAKGRKRALTIAVGATGAAIVGGACIILFMPALAQVVGKVIGESVLNKASSDSAIERSSWNHQAWQIFLDTDGLGAGIGSTRTSSYVMLLLSNLGAIGFALFLVLIARVSFGRLANHLDRPERAVIWAARIGIATALLANLLVGTVYYLGTLFYILLGVAASGIAVRPAPGRRAAPIAWDPDATALSASGSPARR